jgi:hypothetical protein
MTIDEARLWLIKATLGITAALFLFFLVAKPLGFPLRDWDEAWSILRIVLPTFLAYLGSATHFLTRNPQDENQSPRLGKAMAFMVRAPVWTFGFLCLALLFVFGWGSREAASPGEGMSIDQLSTGISILLGFLAVTTGSLIAFLFPARRTARG